MLIIKLLALVIITVQPNGFSVTDRNGDTFTCGNDLMGAYTQGTNILNICKTGTLQTVIHELGHYVFYMKLNDRQREGWYRICGSDKLTCDELFAEEFRNRINGEKYDCYGICDIRERFMDRVLIFLDK